jgi:hypothetical protein
LSTSGFNENAATTMVTEESRAKEFEMQEQDGHRICSEPNTSHDFVSGIMKIVPSDVNVNSLSICCHCFQKDARCQLFLFAGNVNNTCKHIQLSIMDRDSTLCSDNCLKIVGFDLGIIDWFNMLFFFPTKI